MILNCTCFKLRRLSRQITQLYDDSLRPTGLRITQFSLLSILRKEGSMPVVKLANGLGSDPTSISRALRPLMLKKFVEINSGSDKRSKLVCITNEGVRKLLEADLYWHDAQEKVSKSFGAEQLLKLENEVELLSVKLDNSRR